jgi:hypothetical protein
MIEEIAREVVDGLREKGVDAHLHEAGVYTFGVRVALPDGREAIWGTEGAGLAAEVLLDGDLVGLVAEISGSAAFTAEQAVTAILRADYSEPEGRERASDPPPSASLPEEGGLLRRFRDDFRSPD